MAKSNVKPIRKTRETIVSPEVKFSLDAITAAYAYIEFDLDGNIQFANDQFLRAMGYSLEEIKGRHHRMFVESNEANSLEYRKFWLELNDGRTQTREFKRITKAGAPIWINASYIPVKNDRGQVLKIVKLVQDNTSEKSRLIDAESKIAAIGRSQAVIEFRLDGTIVAANDNFLSALGYGAHEVTGQHHAMFVTQEHKNSSEYRIFWEKLNRGEFISGEFKRIAKGGREVWIMASYNPIFDIAGKPCKIVKYATDVTAQKLRNADYQGQLAAISKAQAVIEFDLDGTIITANDNFLTTLGYTLREIQGQHHSMFVPPEHRQSPEYRNFWTKLRSGEYDTGEYCRVGKGGREVWIQASYNPILDMDGKAFKVVKYATDITDRIKLLQELNKLGQVAQDLTLSASSLSASASQMASSSDLTTAQANQAAVAAQDVLKGVEAVATNTEEMQASIQEISRNANEASAMSTQAKTQAQETNKTIQKLGDSSQEIGNVIKVISSIAQQTNLLALNATIEAARAGDAGRGFAVVANEVKELAKQTAKATEEITSKIGAIQADSTGAVKAILEIGSSIDKLNTIAGSIAASVEEQLAVTTEVGRVVKQANTGVQNIVGNIASVSAAADQTTKGASTVLNAAKNLGTTAESVQTMVAKLQTRK